MRVFNTILMLWEWTQCFIYFVLFLGGEPNVDIQICWVLADDQVCCKLKTSPEHSDIFTSNFSVWGHRISQHIDATMNLFESQRNTFSSFFLQEEKPSFHSQNQRRLVIPHLPINVSLFLGFIGQVECKPRRLLQQVVKNIEKSVWNELLKRISSLQHFCSHVYKVVFEWHSDEQAN